MRIDDCNDGACLQGMCLPGLDGIAMETWSNATATRTCFRETRDTRLLEQYRSEDRLTEFPVVMTQNDACQDEHLLDIEVDAICMKD